MTHPVKSPRKLIEVAMPLDAIKDDAADGTYYLRHPFEAVPGWGVSSINFEIKALLERAEKR
jgi:hypothetical protein